MYAAITASTSPTTCITLYHHCLPWMLLTSSITDPSKMLCAGLILGQCWPALAPPTIPYCLFTLRKARSTLEERAFLRVNRLYLLPRVYRDCHDFPMTHSLVYTPRLHLAQVFPQPLSAILVLHAFSGHEPL